MFIVFGTRGRQVKRGEGRFYCPSCQDERNYIKYKVATYFTLFFIPTFPIKNYGEHLHCTGCTENYNLSILDLNEHDFVKGKILSEACDGIPLQMIQNRLGNEGRLSSVITEIIKELPNDHAVKNCTSCQMSFLAEANLGNCTVCSGELR